MAVYTIVVHVGKLELVADVEDLDRCLYHAILGKLELVENIEKLDYCLLHANLFIGLFGLRSYFVFVQFEFQLLFDVSAPHSPLVFLD